MNRIHLSKADVGPLEEEYVLRAVRSGWVAPLGPEVDAFEREVAERVGVAHALALVSGTAALHLALLELGARQGTAVVLPTMTFAASAMPVVYSGAEPVFVDAVADGNVSPDILLDAVDSLQADGTQVVAAMTVDLFGRTADYDRILPGLAERGIPVLEDAAEALGASYGGDGAGSFGAAAALSFNGNKIMTTSGGGMLLSDDGALIDHARYLSTQARQPVPYYEHVDVGYNYRLSNVLAALGRAQLARLDAMVERRRWIRDTYEKAFADLEGVTVLGREDPDRGDAEDNCWLTCILLDPRKVPLSPDDVITALGAQDIEARHLWKPMHLQPVFAGRRAFLDGTSERLFARGIALPSGSSLTDDDVARVIDAARALLADT